MAEVATESTTGPLVTHPTTVPSTISIKSVVGGEATRTVQPVKRIVKRMSLQQSQPNNCQALVPVQSEVRVPNVNCFTCNGTTLFSLLSYVSSRSVNS